MPLSGQKKGPRERTERTEGQSTTVASRSPESHSRNSVPREDPNSQVSSSSHQHQHSHGATPQQNPPSPITVPHHNHKDLESSSESPSPERVPSSAYHKNCVQGRERERERDACYESPTVRHDRTTRNRLNEHEMCYFTVMCLYTYMYINVVHVCCLK